MSSQHAHQEWPAAEVDGPERLRRLVVLHEGVGRFIREAIRHVERRDFEKAHSAFLQAKHTVMHFLSHIPESDDSDLAANLRGLFSDSHRKVVEGSLRKELKCAEAALRVIRNPRET